MGLQQVPVEWAPKVWGQVSHFFASAVEYAQGELTVEQIQAMLNTGQWGLLIATDGVNISGAAAFSVFNRPSGRIAFIHALGGEGVVSADTLDELKNIMGSLGATEIECAARESAARLYRMCGMHEKYRIVGVKL
jgi:hypothetical protein